MSPLQLLEQVRNGMDQDSHNRTHMPVGRRESDWHLEEGLEMMKAQQKHRWGKRPPNHVVVFKRSCRMGKTRRTHKRPFMHSSMKIALGIVFGTIWLKARENNQRDCTLLLSQSLINFRQWSTPKHHKHLFNTGTTEYKSRRGALEVVRA